MGDTGQSVGNLVAVLPVKGNSSRLKKKNLRQIAGVPIFVLVANAALTTQAITKSSLLISTDSDEVMSICRQFGLRSMRRGKSHLDPDLPTQFILREAVEHYERDSGKSAETIIWLNASFPEVSSSHILACLEKFKSGPFSEVFSILPSGELVSATRIVKRAALFNQLLSTHAAAVDCDYVEIHNETDLQTAKKRMELGLRDAKLASINQEG